MLFVAAWLLLATGGGCGPHLAAAREAGARRVQQVVPAQWAIADGQQLAEAVADYGLSNSDKTFALPPASIVDLRQATFWNGSTNSPLASGLKPFSNGTLTISGFKSWDVPSEEATASSVLDTGMRAGLTPSLVTVQVVLQDVALVNLCQTYIPLGDAVVIGATLLGIFSISLAAQPAFSVRTIYYITRVELLEVAYWQVVTNTPWRAVTDLYVDQQPTMAAMQRLDFEIHAHELLITFPGGSMIWRSEEKPNDPLMTFMRQRGLVLDYRWCHNGSLVPPELLVMAPVPGGRFFALMWTAATLDDLLVGLVNATSAAPLQHAGKMPMPLVMPFLPQANLSETLLPSGTLELTAPIILHGHMRTSVAPATLDLTSRTRPLFNITSVAGQLFIARLVLRVPALPLAALAASVSKATNATNATSSRRGAMIELHNVTLVVPVLDYLALLTLATDNSSVVGSVRGCMDQRTLQQAAQLQPSIRTLKMSTAAWDGLSLAAYTAWGVNSSWLIVQPSTPLPGSIKQRCPVAFKQPSAAPAASADGGSDSSAAPVGLIVGCTVGSVALLAAVVGIVALAWRNQRTKNRAHVPGDGSGDHGDIKGAVFVDLSTAKNLAPSAGSDSGSPKAAGQPLAGALVCAPESRLMALLHHQEQQLLGGRGPHASTTNAAPGAGAAAAATPSNLHQAHQQLMSIVAARQTAQPASGTAAPGSDTPLAGAVSHGSVDTQKSDPQAAVKQAAARLQDQDGGADKLTLERVLGQGGGGTVYKGTWRGLPVAVKTFVFEAVEDGAAGVAGGRPNFRYARAIMETAISASIGHLHVVATYHHDIKRMDDQLVPGDSGGLQVDASQTASMAVPSAGPRIHTFKVFLVQELCTCSLAKALEQGIFQHDHTPSAVLALLHQIASGLEYLHGLGIIHGDLTPGNILLKADCGSRSVLVKLADFGMSNRLEGQATHVSNFGGGTPFYVAPEVVHQKRTSTASDVFSFGIVAWQLLTLSPVYIQAADGTLKANPLFPTFPPDCKAPLALEKLVRRCLMRHPQKRPTATDIMTVLDQQLEIMKV